MCVVIRKCDHRFNHNLRIGIAKRRDQPWAWVRSCKQQAPDILRIEISRRERFHASKPSNHSFTPLARGPTPAAARGSLRRCDRTALRHLRTNACGGNVVDIRILTGAGVDEPCFEGSRAECVWRMNMGVGTLFSKNRTESRWVSSTRYIPPFPAASAAMSGSERCSSGTATSARSIIGWEIVYAGTMSQMVRLGCGVLWRREQLFPARFAMSSWTTRSLSNTM